MLSIKVKVINIYIVSFKLFLFLKSFLFLCFNLHTGRGVGLSATKYMIYVFCKEKTIQNVLKRKICIWKDFILNLLMCISKNYEKNLIIFRCPQKPVVPYGAGVGQKGTNTSATIRFFFYAFPNCVG